MYKYKPSTICAEQILVDKGKQITPSFFFLKENRTELTSMHFIDIGFGSYVVLTRAADVKFLK